MSNEKLIATGLQPHNTRYSVVGTRYFGLSRFDIVVFAVIAGLLVVIAATVALADFRRPGARVAYVAPATGMIENSAGVLESVAQNIWIADPDDPASAEQVTFSADGIFDFGVSPDGRYIAFAERNSSTNTNEIKMIDLRTGALRQLTNCVAEDADCNTPVWRPDGGMIAYERSDENSALTSTGIGPIRVWLIDLTTDPTSTRPLFADTQILGYSPRWSGDGSRIAVYDNAGGGIMVYDFRDGSASLIPSRYGDTGSLSPDGGRLVFPEMAREGNQMFAHLKIADIANRQFSDLTKPDDPVNDAMPVWNPDGARLVISRQYTDNRWTQGHQAYLLDTGDGSVTPLVVDEGYDSSFFEWNRSGDSLVFQRFPVLDDSGTPEVWSYNLQTARLVKVAVDAFHPRWVP